MKKKNIGTHIILIIALCSLCLSACGNNSSANNSSEPVVEDTQQESTLQENATYSIDNNVDYTEESSSIDVVKPHIELLVYSEYGFSLSIFYEGVFSEGVSDFDEISLGFGGYEIKYTTDGALRNVEVFQNNDLIDPSHYDNVGSVPASDTCFDIFVSMDEPLFDDYKCPYEFSCSKFDDSQVLLFEYGWEEILNDSNYQELDTESESISDSSAAQYLLSYYGTVDSREQAYGIWKREYKNKNGETEVVTLTINENGFFEKIKNLTTGFEQDGYLAPNGNWAYDGEHFVSIYDDESTPGLTNILEETFTINGNTLRFTSLDGYLGGEFIRQ